MYKIIYQNMIIDVMNKIKYCKYLQRANRTLLCDKTSANCIVSSNGEQVYHIKGTLAMPTEYKSVEIVPIDKEEYDYLCSLTVPIKTDYAIQLEKEAYEEEVNNRIRAKYTLSQELSILRQRDEKPEEFKEYYDYCEECKAFVKEKKRNLKY